MILRYIRSLRLRSVTGRWLSGVETTEYNRDTSIFGHFGLVRLRSPTIAQRPARLKLKELVYELVQQLEKQAKHN